MLHRHDGDLDPGHPPELVGPDPRGVDDDLGLDRAVVRDDTRYPPVPNRDLPDANAGPDPRTAALGPLRERHREPGRVQVPVRRHELRAEHVRDVDQGEPLVRLLRGDDLDGQAEALRPAGLAGERLEPVGRRREMERPDLVPPEVDPGLAFERGVQLDPVHHHPGVADRVPQLRDQTRRMEGGSARELGAVDEQHVVPPHLRQVVRDARTRDTPADDHDPGAIVRHVRWPRSLGPASVRTGGRPSNERVGRSACPRTRRSRCPTWRVPAGSRPTSPRGNRT